MNAINKLYNDYRTFFYNGDFFEYFENAPEFLSFAKKLKAALNKECKANGLQIAKYNVGFFDVSMMFYNPQNKKYVYSRICDVRDAVNGKLSLDNVMYHTAKSKNYTFGGNNHFSTLPYLIENVAKLIQ